MNVPKSVLLVCLGNICRSPSAEAVLRQKITQKNLDIVLDSAGTAGYHIGEKQLPKLPSVILVGKNVNSNSSNMQFLSKNIKLPEFSLSPFKKDTITTIDFENNQLDYHFTINLDQGLFSAIKNSAYNSLTGSDVPLLSEKEIKKRVKSQISNF